VQDEAEEDSCPTQQLEPSLRTARSTAVRHTLGILMPSRNQIQADPAAEHTHDYLLGRRERVTVRAGLAIPRRLQQKPPCWLFGSGWFLDLPYRVVTIRQVLDTGDTHRVRQYVCPAGSPGTAGSFAGVRSCDAAVLWCIFLALYHASCSVGLLHNTYAAALTQPISFATAAPPSLFPLPPQVRCQTLLAGPCQSQVLSSIFFQFLCKLPDDLPTQAPDPELTKICLC